MSGITVVMFVGEGDLAQIMFNGLKKQFFIKKVIMERKVPKRALIKKRIKRLGLFRVIGQILFIAYNTILSILSKNQIENLKKKYSLSDLNYPCNILHKVENINDNETVDIISSIRPDVIIVCGTRIISEKVLASINSIFLNIHTGITPKYRGVHGGYWALTRKDFKNCGVTVHLVDKGIDTGGILYQDTIEINDNDNFNTYPYHQIKKAIPLMLLALNDVSNNNIKVKKRDDLSSKIWSHPTIIDYLKYRYLRGIK